MKRRLALLTLAILGGCTRPQHPHPLVPQNTQYTTGSQLAAGGGMLAAAAGASVANNSHSSGAKTAGNAAMAAGMALMAASLIDAVEVQKSREQFWNLMRAFNRAYSYFPPIRDDEREAPPPVPEVPFNFKDDEPTEGDP